MSTEAEAAVGRVREALDGRQLIWFGIRGEDGEALLRIEELSASFSVIAKLRSSSIADRSIVSLEDLTGLREDLDTFDIDEAGAHASAAVHDLRRRLLAEVSGPSVLVPYRPSALVSALAFARRDTMQLAGMHKDRQSIFENKPWVETELEKLGVRGLGWEYFADEHRHLAQRVLTRGPHIVRASRTSGGVGIALVRNADELQERWPVQQDHFVGLARYLDPTIPINLSGCVFADGSVRLHPASVQLIGLPSCTSRPYGYAGNDFGALKLLPAKILDELDVLGQTVGKWLHSERYRGVFGVDALVHNGAVHFTEINARFQGSSALSARIAQQADLPDLYIDHLTASLGLSQPSPQVTIRDWAELQPDLAKIVPHNRSDVPVVRDRDYPLPARRQGVRIDQFPGDGQRIAADGVLGSLTFNRSITTTGFEIDSAAEQLADELTAGYKPADTELAS